MNKSQKIQISVACFVFKDSRLLLGKRVSKSHGHGDYTCGGGKVEFGENLAEAATREIQEE